METKYCKRCKQTKLVSDFGKCKFYKDGLSFYCKACNRYKNSYFKKSNPAIYSLINKKHYDKYRKDTVELRYSNLCSRAKRYKIPLTVTKEEFINWFNSQDKICHYCKSELTTLTVTKDNFTNGLTIDKKDCKRGYEISNMVLACRRCNYMKGNWLSYEQTIEIANKYFINKP